MYLLEEAVSNIQHPPQQRSAESHRTSSWRGPTSSSRPSSLPRAANTGTPHRTAKHTASAHAGDCSAGRPRHQRPLRMRLQQKPAGQGDRGEELALCSPRRGSVTLQVEESGASGWIPLCCRHWGHGQHSPRPVPAAPDTAHGHCQGQTSPSAEPWRYPASALVQPGFRFLGNEQKPPSPLTAANKKGHRS